MSVEVHGGWATVEIDLNPREHGLRDKMKALVVNSYQVFPLKFEPFALLTPDGNPNPAAALPRIQEILDEALVLPDNEKNRLLRSATAPNADTLLRPARDFHRVRPDELLRPVTRLATKTRE